MHTYTILDNMMCVMMFWCGRR